MNFFGLHKNQIVLAIRITNMDHGFARFDLILGLLFCISW